MRLKLCGTFGARLRHALCALALVIGAALVGMAPAFAQGESSGGISGSVRLDDQPVSAAEVTVRNLDTGLTRTVVADADGRFRLALLPVGDYEVTAQSPTQADLTRSERVSVRVGANSAIELMLASTMAVVEVTASTPGLIDTYSTDSGLQIGQSEIDRLPVGRNATAIALLAPGVVGGDGGFGNLPSFGGASVAENAYYVNGLNVTNLRNGLGGPDVPFEFYQDFQVKTGGYSAEFGRSTGGVVNAVTRSGSNDWEGGVNFYLTPNRLREQSPDVRNRDGTAVVVNTPDRLNEYEFNVNVGGPLLKDKLFAYALLSPRDVSETDFAPDGTRTERDQNGVFWGLSIDWLLSDYHTLALTAFSDQRDIDLRQRNWDPDSGETSGDARASTRARGGDSALLKYTGFLTDSFSVSALIGQSKSDLTDSSPLDVNPVIFFTDDSANFTPLGNFGAVETGRADDQRTALRLDFDWNIGAHTLSFGIDREKLESFEDKTYSGGVYYEIHQFEDPAQQDFAWVFHQSTFGKFETLSDAAYVEGAFRFGDVSLTTGIRSDRFENKNGLGGTFVDMGSQYAPRLGASWDIGGDGDDKLYGNLGRYYLPVANILNIRLAGAFFADETRYELDGINADGTPILGTILDPTFVQFDGEVADPRTIVNENIKPMYQDEAILGYAFRFGENWSADVNTVYRRLGRAIEDSTPCNPLDQLALQRYGIEDYCLSISPPYVLTNPGSGMVFYHDFGQGDGLERLAFSAAELGYPKASRTYRALNFSLRRAYADDWSLAGSYTWSRSQGNYEGTVRSDGELVEENAGFTTLYDFPSLLENSDGYLPNDRRHVLKIWGNWGFAEDWELGWNWLSASGRPISHLGLHPTDLNAQVYESAAFYQNGLPAPRGSFGRTDWLHQLDLSLSYAYEVGGYQGNLRLQVLNVLDLDTETGVYEEGEFDATPSDPYPDDPNYGVPLEFQMPRTLVLSAELRF